MDRRKIPRRISSGIIGVLVVWVLVGLGVVGAVVSTPIVEEPLGENSAQTIVGDEVVGLRTETSKTYYLGESTYAVEAALWPVHYQDEGWQEIDNAWVPATAPWNWEMTHDSYHAYVLNQFTYGQILKFELEGESVAFQPMELQWTNDLSMIQTISMTQDVLVEVTNEPTELLTGMEGSIGSIRWNNAYGSGRHFEFTTTPGKLQTLLQLDAAPPEPLEYIINGGNPVMRQSFIFDPSTDLDIYVNNMTWDKKTKVQTVENIEFRLDGETVWYFWQARYWDSGNSTEVAITILRKDGNDLWLDVLVPYEWLQTAVYPIFIDPDTGATYPGLGSTEDRDGKAFWSYPTNIQEEGYYAYCGVAASTYGDWLRASDFGFSIPSTAVIDGIKIEINKEAVTASAIKDSSLRLVDASGTNVGDDKASASYWSTDPTTATYGGDSDTWGATLTPAIVNDSDFGVRLSPANTYAALRSAYVYWVKITVYYTDPPIAACQAASNIGATTARLNGIITDDKGNDCEARFRYGEYLQGDDFEWGIDGDDITESGGDITWTKGVGGTSTAKISTDQKVSGTRSLELHRDGTNDASVYFTHAPTDEAYQFNLRWVTGGRFIVRHGDGTYEIYFHIAADGGVEYYDGGWQDTGATVTTATWHKLEFSNVNWGAGTYDIYCDDELIQSSAAMYSNAGTNGLVRLANVWAGSTDIYIDDVLVHEVKVLAAGDFEWGSNGDPLSDDGGSIDWTIGVAGTSKAEIDTDITPYQGTRCARLYRDGTNNPAAKFSQTAITFGQSIEFWARKDTNGYLIFWHGDGTHYIRVHIHSNEYIYYYDGTSYSTDTAILVDTWYLLSIRNVNWVAATYDIYLNGSLIWEGATMATSASYANEIFFGNYDGTSEVWIDSILVHEDWTLTEWQNSLNTDSTYYEDIESLDPVTDYVFQTQAREIVGDTEGAWSASAYFETAAAAAGYSFGVVIG